MYRARRRTNSWTHRRQVWRPRASVRRAVALRVDYATANGRLGLGLVRNLSLQGLYMAHTSDPGTPAVAPGDRLTVVVVLPSGQACKLQAVVVHGNRHGCGLQFGESPPHARASLARYWSELEAQARKDLEGPASGAI